MFRAVTLLTALMLLAVGPSFGGQLIFDFSSGNNGGFSAAELGVPNMWTFNGDDWRVNGTGSTNRTLLGPTFIASGGAVTVTISHNVSFETTFDGAVLAMQVGASPITQITSFSQGGYNSDYIVSSFPSGYGGPGWTGVGTYLSIANAGDLSAGTSFVLRFEAAWDGSVLWADPNWRITSVTVSGIEDSGSAIPEPSTVMLVLAGLSALWLARRRR
ncbi:MAG: PEP-CTERM sorting domain-containing protein [Bryobacterales bacterium]|nr:PEP-CTERM sorting domain-containing protein [Bryobacterales bacterium]